MTPAEGPAAELRLAEHRFLRGMDPDFVERLTRSAYERRYDAGTLLVREGDPAEEFILIYQGKVALEIALPDRPRKTIQTVGPGEVLGWSWLLPPHQWHLDARAVKPTRVLGLAAAHLRAVLNEDPASGYQFLLRLLPVVVQRLENARLQLLDLHGI